MKTFEVLAFSAAYVILLILGAIQFAPLWLMGLALLLVLATSIAYEYIPYEEKFTREKEPEMKEERKSSEEEMPTGRVEELSLREQDYDSIENKLYYLEKRTF